MQGWRRALTDSGKCCWLIGVGKVFLTKVWILKVGSLVSSVHAVWSERYKRLFDFRMKLLVQDLREVFNVTLHLNET